MRMVAAGELIAGSRSTVDPSKFPEERFELWSIPAFDKREPDAVLGREIGSQKQAVRPGDVLLSKIVPHIRRAWVVIPSRSGLRQIASSEWIVFRTADADPEYLRHLLTSGRFHAEFMSTVSGVGGSLMRARPSYVAKIQVPLPPIEEQRRIAAILDKADELRANRRAALAHLDSLTQSIFLEMFGNSSKYELVELGTIADVQGGLQVTTARSVNPVEVPYIRVANVQRGRLDLSEIKSIRATDAEVRRTRLQRGDVLLVEGHGNPAEIGRAAEWDDSIPECVHQNHIIRARPRSEVHSRYLTEYLNSAPGRSHLLRAANTTSGLNTISVSVVKSAPIALPSICDQNEFAQRCAASDELRGLHHAASTDVEGLFESLQQRAFSGAL